MGERRINPVEDYTTTCLILFGLNLFWMLIVVWVAFGLPIALGLAYALDRIITRLGRRRQPRART